MSAVWHKEWVVFLESGVKRGPFISLNVLVGHDREINLVISHDALLEVGSIHILGLELS